MKIDDVKRAQRVLRDFGGYAGRIDGAPGARSMAAAGRVLSLAGGCDVPVSGDWPAARVVIAAAQAALKGAGFDPGAIDGFWGPGTDAAFLQWSGADIPAARPRPASDAEIRRRFGAPGSAACSGGRVVPPWPMRIAWDPDTPVKSFACHEDAAGDISEALGILADHYDPSEIVALGLDLYGGCYNYRKKRGGSSLSLHSWGVAIDFDPARNRLNWGADRARLAQPDAAAFFGAWSSVGWYGLGPVRGYDYMHVQAVRP